MVGNGGRHVDERRSTYPRVALLTALAIICAAPAQAETITYDPSIPITADTYNPRLLPVLQTPTNRVKNIVGRAAEATCLRNGRAAAVCAVAGVAAGGVGLARLTDKSWSQIASEIGGSTATSALGNAVAGCAIGGAVGAWGAGVGFIPGCMIGALDGAIVGGFLGAAGGTFNLLRDGSVTTDSKAGMGGDVTGTAKSGPNNNASSGNVSGINEVYYGDGVYTPQLQTYGIGNEFVCTDSQGAYHVCMLVGVNYTNPTTFKPFNPSTIPGDKWVGPKGTAAASACAYNQCQMWMSTQTWPAAQAKSIPTTSYQGVTPVRVAAGGFSKDVPVKSLDKQLDPNVVAALVTAALRAAGSNAGAAANDTVTAADVDKVAQDDPSTPPMTLGDLIRPVADLNSGGGTAANPLHEPTQVVNVGNTGAGASTGTPTGTKTNPTVTEEKADKDLDEEVGGSVGNPIQPVIDFITGPLAPFFSPKFNKVEAACPVFTVDSSTFFQWFIDNPMNGRKGGDAAVQRQAQSFFKWKSDSLCTFFDSHYSSIQLISTLILAVCAVYWFFGVKG